MSSTKSCESVNDTKSMVTAFSGSICEEERAITPTENETEYIKSLKEEITQLQEINLNLKEEKAQWAMRQRLQQSGQSESSLISMLEDRLNQAENQIQDYRDENTVLKCELRELQETTYATSDDKLKEKMKATEGLCDELMEENEQLKAEVKDLQQEIEEMQDQYREEEIEEFRELQRELELNAKNCRVLQFKLRKTERRRDQLEAEKTHAESKLEEFMNSCPDAVAEAIKSDSAKVKELESEIRIGKEVSVSLHNELEQSEEKRCKLEEEVFYLKEKVREIQTQNKWRESRSKTDMVVKRLSTELNSNLADIDLSKELRDALEREIDIKEQLRFTEKDLKRTQLRATDLENENEELLSKISKTTRLRPPMTRSASDGNAILQLELAESQVQTLNTKLERLEMKNELLNQKIAELETDCTRGGPVTLSSSNAGHFKMTPEMEKDMSKMIATISELERKNHELANQVKQLEAKPTTKPNFVVPSGTTTMELRSEQEKRKALEAQVNELKATIFKSDNQKIIVLATKIEQLNNQLQLVNDRCNILHKKQMKENDSHYSEELKKKLEETEKLLSEKIAQENVNELQGKIPTTDEIEQCCEVLAAVEMQTSRLCKQFGKLDNAQKDERRRSLSKESGAAIIAELANVMQEMKNVHTKLDNIKSVSPGVNVKNAPSAEHPPDVKCAKCEVHEQAIEQQQNEIGFYKKKNKDLTNQVLQTEDRWTIEIEKQRQIFENEIKTLGLRAADLKRQNDELSELLESKSTTLIEKTRALEEQEERNKKMKKEVDTMKKTIQDIDSDNKCVKEFEIKYNKLESIFEAEREKMNIERNRAKNELASIKKMKDDMEEHLKTVTDENKKNEAAWKASKTKLEREISLLKKQLPDEHVMQESVHMSQSSNPGDSSPTRRQDPDQYIVLDLKKQITLLEKKVTELETSLDESKIRNAELKDQLARTETGWNRDRETFHHKTRQSEKLRTVETDAMQQKFGSRMRIMQDTNRSLHSQLILARRERDSLKETLENFQKSVKDERNAMKLREKNANESADKIKELQNQLAEKDEELERLNTDLRLTKEGRKADQILWNIDRARSRNEKIDNTDSVEAVRKQYRDCETFYSKELDRLNDKITEITSEKNRLKNESQKTIKNLLEQIRVLEIEQKNLSQNKDCQQAANEMVESERERLQQLVHLNELQKLTRKYRLSSIIDQLAYVSETTRKISRESEPDGIRYIINQLITLRDDEATNNLNSDERAGSVFGDGISNGYAPSISECGEGTYDNISQSSFSVRSITAAPLRHAYRSSNHPLPPPTVTSVSTTVSEAEPQYSEPKKLANSQRVAKRSFSTESSCGFDRYGRQIRRGFQQEPSSSNNLSVPGRKTSNDEYSMSRAASFDNRSQFSEDDHDELQRSRPNSTGTNILYRVRREELARGGQPSVKLMAKAFESVDDAKPDRRGFFGIRKSRSVETQNGKSHKKFEEAADSALIHSLSQVHEGVSSNYATLPRGGRNPFKNMGSRLVERVRRSLSRSSRQSRESDKEDEIEVQVFKKTEKPASSPKKTKKKSAESKARKNSTNFLA